MLAENNGLYNTDIDLMERILTVMEGIEGTFVKDKVEEVESIDLKLLGRTHLMHTTENGEQMEREAVRTDKEKIINVTDEDLRTSDEDLESTEIEMTEEVVVEVDDKSTKEEEKLVIYNGQEEPDPENKKGFLNKIKEFLK